MMLREYLDNVYAVERSLQPNSLYQYEVATDAITRWAGEPIALEDLCDDMVNKWLMHLAGAHLAPTTIRNRRQHLMALWHAACEADLAPHQPRRIRREPIPWSPPRAWTYEEVQKLLAAAERLQGHYPKFPAPSQRIIRRATCWGLLIRLAWDTGLRTGDIMALRPRSISADGVVEIIQSKTRRHHLTRIHPETQAAIVASFPPPDDTLIPWYTSGEYLRREFKCIVRSACIEPGSFKKLRKSSGTEIEMLYPGCGGAHLGHAAHQDMARLHYLDPRLLIANKPMPRPLRVLAQTGGAA